MNEQLESLAYAYLQGAAGPDECRRLDALLRDADARREFIRAALLETELPTILAEAPARVADDVWMPLRSRYRLGARAACRLPGCGKPGRLLSWRRIAWTSSSALAGVAAIVAFAWYSTVHLRYRVPDPALVAKVTHVAGVARVASLNEEGSRRLSAGDSVSPDCRIAGEKGTKLTLTYPDGSTLRLVNDTRIMSSSSASIRLIYLDSGTIVARITPRDGGRKLIFATPHAVIRVVGTQFTLSADADASRVEVEEGKLILTSKKNDTSLVVGERDTAIVGSETTLGHEDSYGLSAENPGPGDETEQARQGAGNDQ